MFLYFIKTTLLIHNILKTIIKFDRSDNESSSLFIEESKKYRKFILKFLTSCHIDRYLIFFVVLIPSFEPFLRGLFFFSLFTQEFHQVRNEKIFKAFFIYKSQTCLLKKKSVYLLIQIQKMLKRAF